MVSIYLYVLIQHFDCSMTSKYVNIIQNWLLPIYYILMWVKAEFV